MTDVMGTAQLFFIPEVNANFEVTEKLAYMKGCTKQLQTRIFTRIKKKIIQYNLSGIC